MPPAAPCRDWCRRDGGMRRPGQAITLREDGVDRWFAWRGLAGVPGFAPHQPIPSGPEVSVAVPLTCWFTVTGCYDVQVKCAPSVSKWRAGQQALDRCRLLWVDVR